MDNTNNQEKQQKNKNTKLIIIIICIIMLIVIAVVVTILIINSYNKKTNEIIKNLGIDDYFKYVFTTEYKKDTNLIDINNEEQMFMYYYYNKNTKIYKIDFKDPTFEGNLFLTYAKYDDYMNYHKKVFAEKSKHEMSMYDIDVPQLKHVGNDVYNVENQGPIQCSMAENTNNCYIKLTKDTGITGNVTISELDRKDNVITGKASFNSKSEYFEFTYEEKDDNYIIKSLKVVDKIE